MQTLAWLVSALLAAQSLGEIAEREKKRRERNAEAGVEVVSYTMEGGTVSGEGPPQVSRPSPEPAEEAEGASPLDAERERGMVMEPRVAEVSRAADGVDALYRRYMDTCHNRYLVGVAPFQFGVPAAPSSPIDVEMARGWSLDAPGQSSSAGSGAQPPRTGIVLVESPQCQTLRAEVLTAMAEVKRAMQELLQQARRERILPGVMRELLQKYRLG